MLASISPAPTPVPDHLSHHLRPATHTVPEWQPLRFDTGGGWRWSVAGRELPEQAFGGCEYRFENRVGTVHLHRWRDGCRESLVVEVLSNKASTPDAHLTLFRQLEADLHRRCAALAFTFDGDTGRGVSEALRPPSPLFTLQFLSRYADELAQALHIVAGSPHRLLRDRDDWVPTGAASDLDADTLLAIVGHPEHLARSDRLPLAQRLHGLAPTRIWQRLPEETFDTAENRFVRGFCESLAAAADALPRQPWWRSVPRTKLTRISEARSAVGLALLSEPLVDAGPMRRLPTSSQVLLRRDGYLELRYLWQRFQLARRPLFGALAEALDLRDVATLYEMWVFLELVAELEQVTGVAPTVHIEPELRRTGQTAVAHFGDAGKLLYNQGREGYSGLLRPDFLWHTAGRDRVAFDAKFRLTADELSGNDVARRADLDKMHAYRDALRLDAAVCVYPGDVSRFYSTDGAREEGPLVAQVVNGLAGAGALAWRPGEG